MPFTKEDILAIKSYILKIRAFNQKFNIDIFGRKHIAHNFDDKIGEIIKLNKNKKNKNEIVSDDLKYAYFAHMIAGSEDSFLTMNYSTIASDFFEMNGFENAICRAIIDSGLEIPDDIKIEGRNIYTSNKEFLDYINKNKGNTNKVFDPNLMKDDFNYFKFDEYGKNGEKLINTLNQLLITTRIEIANAKSKLEAPELYHYGTGIDALSELENIFVVSKTDEDKYKSANRAIIQYFFRKSDVNDDDLKKDIMNTLNLNEEQMELLESIVLQKNNDKFKDVTKFSKIISNKLDKKIKEMNIDFKTQTVNDFYKDKTQIEKSKNINDILTEVAMYKKCKESYAEATKSTGFFDWIKKYFSKEARELRSDMKKIEKSLKNDNLKVNKLDFKKGLNDLSNDISKQINNNVLGSVNNIELFNSLSSKNNLKNETEKLDNIEIEDNIELINSTKLEKTTKEYQIENEFIK